MKKKLKPLTSKHFILFLTLTSTLFSQNQILETIAFYNVENLFDTIDDPYTLDEISPILELSHQREAVYRDKLLKIATVLSQIGKSKTNAPPSVIGLVEVENQKVLEDLIQTPPLNNYNYGIIHIDSKDRRGIDTALIYHKKNFTPINYEVVTPNIVNENGYVLTRDILWCSGYLADEKIHFIVNHWPSRRGGVLKTKQLRNQAAHSLITLLKKIKTNEPNAKIVVMGDFNDNPTNKSVKQLTHKSTLDTLINTQLYNPFLKMYKEGYHSLVFRGKFYLFDQMLFSFNFFNSKEDDFQHEKSSIYNPNYLTNQTGKYRGQPKRSFGNGNYLNGYSDHYPVYSLLRKHKQ